MLTQGLNFSAPRQYNVKGKVSFDTMLTRLGETTVQVTKIREIVRDGLTPNAPAQTYEGRRVQIGMYGDLVGHRWLFDTVQIAALKEKVGRKQVPMSLDNVELDNVELALSGTVEPGTVEPDYKKLYVGKPYGEVIPVEPVKVDTPAPNLARVVKSVREAVECLPGMTITRKGSNFSITVSGEGDEDENVDQGFQLLDQAVKDLGILSQDPALCIAISGEVGDSTYEIQIRLDSTRE